MRRSGTHGTRKATPKTPEEVESALAAEMEVTHQLAHEVDSIVEGQANPRDIALELNRERQLRGQPPVNEQQDNARSEGDLMAEEEEEERKTGREKKRVREDEEGTQAEVPVAAEKRRKKKKRTKTTDADEASKAKPEDDPRVAAFREEVRSRSMDLMHGRIPANIIELHALYQKLVSEMKPPGETVEIADTATPHFASNLRTQELVAMVKKQITELVDIAGSVRLWLQFNIPAAGGQDFDAKVKEEIANELEHVNATGQSVIDTLKNFPISRSLLIAQITKRQDVEDFRKGLPYLDFHHQLMLQRWVKDLRNMYLSLNNTLQQNVTELSQAGTASADKAARRKRLTDSLSPPMARRQPQQGRNATTGRRNSSSRHSSSPFK